MRNYLNAQLKTILKATLIQYFNEERIRERACNN